VTYIVILGLNALLSYKAKTNNTRICLFVMNHKPNIAITVIKSFHCTIITRGTKKYEKIYLVCDWLSIND
jgi:hypothetical protein